MKIEGVKRRNARDGDGDAHVPKGEVLGLELKLDVDLDISLSCTGPAVDAQRDQALLRACQLPLYDTEALSNREVPLRVPQRDGSRTVGCELGNVRVVLELDVGGEAGRLRRGNEVELDLGKGGVRDEQFELSLQVERGEASISKELK